MLKIENLSVSYGDFKAVDNVSFSVPDGVFAALVGESGSGKSTIGHALLRLNDAATVTGFVLLDGQDLNKLSDTDWQRVRGGQIAMIFQEPMSSLNPLHRVGKQIGESLRLHGLKADKKTVLNLLREVELTDVERIFKSFPHALSGGQRQRVMIAMALAANPKILIADEPTTALDVTVQAQILKLLKRLQHKRGLSILLITHDLNLVRAFADTVFVLKAGKLVGNTLPPKEKIKYKYGFLKSNPVLVVKNLNINYNSFHAVKDVSFTLRQGETIGLAGESGSGKSSVGQALMRLIQATGEVVLNNQNYFDLRGKALTAARTQMQMVLQDPAGSLNPRMRVADIIGEGLFHFHLSKIELLRKTITIMKRLNLNLNLHNRYPHELSGGQKVRVALARVLILNPSVLILDEVTTALDKTTAQQLIDLLLKVQRETGLSIIFISHDLSVLAEVADTLVIMQNGRIVETGGFAKITQNPQHPYTRLLLKSII